MIDSSVGSLTASVPEEVSLKEVTKHQISRSDRGGETPVAGTFSGH